MLEELTSGADLGWLLLTSEPEPVRTRIRDGRHRTFALLDHGAATARALPVRAFLGRRR
jgi:hypothetical protein